MAERKPEEKALTPEEIEGILEVAHEELMLKPGQSVNHYDMAFHERVTDFIWGLEAALNKEIPDERLEDIKQRGIKKAQEKKDEQARRKAWADQAYYWLQKQREIRDPLYMDEAYGVKSRAAQDLEYFLKGELLKHYLKG